MLVQNFEQTLAVAAQFMGCEVNNLPQSLKDELYLLHYDDEPNDSKIKIMVDLYWQGYFNNANKV